MKAYFSIIIFVLLTVSSVVTGTGNYMDAKDRIASDLNRALVRALSEKGGEWVTADTIRVCKQLQAQSTDVVAMLIRDELFTESLSIPELRGKSYVSFALIPQGGTQAVAWKGDAGVSGDTVVMRLDVLQNADMQVAFRGNADCSFATVLGLSDQRLPVVLMLAAMLWGVFSMFYMRRRAVKPTVAANFQCVGGLQFDSSRNAFYTMSGDFSAEEHKLSKAEICAALWPGKPDASETLYTLIRRLKRVVEQDTNIKIEAERGRAYKLRVES